ncbi:hypothetical protein FRC11_009982 [Ceratobasidium sp. 423]|nr:hypothetical protein FRC11_009982 [Ceratobasidium sp. 423]
MSANSKDASAIKDRIIRHMNEDHHDSLVDYLRFYAKVPAHEAATAELVDINNGGMKITRVTEPNGSPRPIVVAIDPPMDSLNQARERLVAMAFEAMEGLGRSRWRVDSYPKLSLMGLVYGVSVGTMLALTLFPNETLRPGANARQLLLFDSEIVARWLYTYQRELRSIIMGSAVYTAIMPMRRRLQKHSYKSGWGQWLAWSTAALLEGPVACISFDSDINSIVKVMPAKDAPLFDPSLEVAADKIEELADDALPRSHISVIPVMCWKPTTTNPLFKYSFLTDDRLRLEIHFNNAPHLVLGQRVLICLKGVDVEPRPTLKRPKLPFKLVFPQGVVLQVDGQIGDTFPEEPPSSPKVPSWFKSQTMPPSSPIPSSPAHGSSPQRADSPPHSRIQLGSSPKRESGNTSLSSPLSTKQLQAPLPQDWAGSTAGKRYRQSAEDVPMSEIRPEPPTRSRGDAEPTEALSPNNSAAQRPKKKRRRNKKSIAPEKNPALDMTAGCRSPLGGAYIPLAELSGKTGTKVSVIGLVRGISLPKVSRNGDWFVSTELLDPSTTEQTALKVNLFLSESSKDCIPNVKAGDILMIWKLTIAQYNGRICGTGYTDSFQWAGYSPTQRVHFHSTHRTFLDEDHCFFLTPGEEELQYASRLADWWSALQELAKSKSEGVPTLMSQPKGRSLITLSEAKVDVFFNCIVEILYTVPPGDQYAEIFVTDYTIHNQLFTRRPSRENDTREKVKVYGKRVLKVVLWGDTQLAHARELETPGYYYIDNLRVKFDSKGYLEGTLQDDKRKIDKLRKDDPLLVDLLKRRQEYIDNPPSLEGETSRRGMDGRDPNLYSAGDLLPPPPLPLKQPEPKQQGPDITRLRLYNITQTPIRKILGHPTCPELFRLRARIRAFEPYKLENFSLRYCAKCRTDLLPQYKACHDCADFDREYVAYEYRFQMVVEEESADATGYHATLVVDVSGEEAENFLSGLPPADLRDSKKATKLRRRLAPVLGTLETYQLDIMTDNSLKAITHGQYFDMLIHSHLSEHKNEGSLDNRRYRLWGTELIPAKAPA